MTKDYFLDTSIIIAAIVGTSEEAFKLIFTQTRPVHTIEYVLKEVYHVLKKKLKFSEKKIGDVIEKLLEIITIHKNPPPNAFKKIDIRDKSDKPIVYSARELNCILVIEDEQTFEDAKKYVKVKKLEY